MLYGVFPRSALHSVSLRTVAAVGGLGEVNSSNLERKLAEIHMKAWKVHSLMVSIK